MMNRAAIGLSLALWAGSVFAQPLGPLADASWVAQNACREHVRVLDIRSQKIDGEGKSEYELAHIPCAVHSDYVKDGWRTKKNGVSGMLPTVGQLERLIGGLGIDQDVNVVIAPLGKDAKSMASAARVYWTFKVMGHDKVSILDGGTLGYAADKSRPVASGVVTPTPRIFHGRVRPEMLPAAPRDILEAAAQGTVLVDYRRTDEFLGINRNDKTEHAGTLPGARNLPIEWLTADNGGSLRPAESLRRLIEIAEIDPAAPQIAFCNTGHNSSLGWFVTSELLGNPRVRLYDESMAGWSQGELPIERKVVVSD